MAELLDQIPTEKLIASVAADSAFDTRKCHEPSLTVDHIYLSALDKADTAEAFALNEILRPSKRVGRTI